MGIEFQEDNYSAYSSRLNNPQDAGSGIGNWFVRAGLAKDGKSANILLVVLTLMFFGASIYFFVFGFSLPEFGSQPIIEDDFGSEMM